MFLASLTKSLLGSALFYTAFHLKMAPVIQEDIKYHVFNNSNWESIQIANPDISGPNIRWKCAYAAQNNNVPFYAVVAYAQKKLLGVPISAPMLVGSAFFEEGDEKGEWEIDDIGVDTEGYKGKGIGSMLVKVAEDVLQPTKLYTMSLPEATGFYEKIGFSPCFDQTPPTKEEQELLIRKRINDLYVDTLTNGQLEEKIKELIKNSKPEDFGTGGYMVKEYKCFKRF